MQCEKKTKNKFFTVTWKGVPSLTPTNTEKYHSIASFALLRPCLLPSGAQTPVTWQPAAPLIIVSSPAGAAAVQRSGPGALQFLQQWNAYVTQLCLLPYG